MSKIHDSKILNSQIDFENSIIKIKVITEQEEQLNMIFEEFLAFHFENQLPDSVLLDIVEEKVDSFTIENKDLLEKEKDYFWPIDYEDVEDLINYIKDNSYHYYKIHASYGLNGWILSKKYSFK
ncbi:hypothetical protein [Oceanobacillus sp. J11TS1]|uniref:hypothetical protein n=1 Tax=Oceanobacillus sp. J11TS1 TaxID=2807191 RepID=UPI001AFE03F7|nr:hypothetical protein [Oceanobacillus sp. J11TS1]GIO24386.1 hypothetical protein J11TS1_29670 [Oceanobacillus sp. J11TS1]